jgi:hypothetical protein
MDLCPAVALASPPFPMFKMLLLSCKNRTTQNGKEKHLSQSKGDKLVSSEEGSQRERQHQQQKKQDANGSGMW